MKSLTAVQQCIRSCRACPNMVGLPVHGPPIQSPVLLLGQAPGPHEGERGRPFAHTAGKTLFRWFSEVSGIDEAVFRERIYMAAVARCYPGKGKGAGDRVPDRAEIARCGQFLRQEVAILKPKLVLAVGKLAITQTLGAQYFGPGQKLTGVVGKIFRVSFYGHPTEVICLPHPSGLSSWHKTEPGITLLGKALRLVIRHPAWIETVG